MHEYDFYYRITSLEKVFKIQCSPVENVQELREAVDQLRNKLENCEHLSWLGTKSFLYICYSRRGVYADVLYWAFPCVQN